KTACTGTTAWQYSSSPHNSIRVHVRLTMASHRKNGRTWCAVSLNTTNPCAGLPLSTACPMRLSGVFFVVVSMEEQDKLLSFPLPVFEKACERFDLSC